MTPNHRDSQTHTHTKTLRQITFHSHSAVGKQPKRVIKDANKSSKTLDERERDYGALGDDSKSGFLPLKFSDSTGQNHFPKIIPNSSHRKKNSQ